MARAKPELRPSGIASGLRPLGGRSELVGLDKFLLGVPANLKVSLNICRGISIQLRCRDKRIAPRTRRTFAICLIRSIAGRDIRSAIRRARIWRIRQSYSRCSSRRSVKFPSGAGAEHFGDCGSSSSGKVFCGVRWISRPQPWRASFAARGVLPRPLGAGFCIV